MHNHNKLLQHQDLEQMLQLHHHFSEDNQSQQYSDKQLVQMQVREVVLEGVQPLGLPHHQQQTLSLEAEPKVKQRYSEPLLQDKLLLSLGHPQRNQQHSDRICFLGPPLKQVPALHLHLGLAQDLVKECSEIIRHKPTRL